MPPSRTAIAAHFGLANFPVAYCGLKIITSLSLRFPDFQRAP
ncbi:Serine/threonine protein kinase [methanotrophic endosymbiont of Bathymodiolus azoricus (Menez Gwen)]|nr:Serine/threonine protein kinase [methanotrophic endosymbiont of Bathymodiolus azoricus (Menez Gwen)]